MSEQENKPKSYLELSGINLSDLQNRLKLEEMLGLDRTGVPSPGDNANKVVKEVSGKFTHWEMICFCIETLAALALIAPFLEDGARRSTQALYTAHYGFRLYDDDVSKIIFMMNKPSDNDAKDTPRT